jgi:trimeric autotransporter adhesin
MNNSMKVRVLTLLLSLQIVVFASVSSGQTVTTVAGGFVGDGRPATQASFQEPQAVAVDAGHNAFVTDRAAHRIRKISSSGTISTIAGTGISGYSGDGGPASAAMISFPTGITLDPSGNLIFADGGNSRVRKIDSAGKISTIAGNGVFAYGGDGGPATQASLEQAWGVTYDSAENLYVSDIAACVVRKVDSHGIITTYAGNGACGFGGDSGPATQASMNAPTGVITDPARNLYVSDLSNHRVRRVNSAEVITTIAGNGQPGFSGDGGPATQAAINNPGGLGYQSGVLYIGGNAGKSRVRMVSSNGTIDTFAGSSFGYDGDNHPPLSTQFANPSGVLPLPAGFFGFTDKFNARVRLLSGGLIKTVGGGYLGDGSPAPSAALVGPENVAFDTHGNAYIADADGNRIRKVDTTGKITTVAGTGVSGYTNDGGLATQAELDFPYGVAVDANGNIYIADNFVGAIRKVNTSGIINTFAISPNFFSLQTLVLDRLGNLFAVDSGTCVVWKFDGNGNATVVAGVEFVCGYNGDNIQASTAQLNGPYGIAFDSLGNLYIADSGNNRVRRVNTSGVITTVVGDGNCGYMGDNGPPTAAEMCFPEAVVIAGSTMYIADTLNLRIRRVGGNIITTYAGTGIQGYNGNGLAALSTNLDDPVALAVDPSGNLYELDDVQNRLRRIH